MEESLPEGGQLPLLRDRVVVPLGGARLLADLHQLAQPLRLLALLLLPTLDRLAALGMGVDSRLYSLAFGMSRASLTAGLPSRL